MLTKLRIKNFKSWQDTGEMRMAPLTMFFGANSSGKSSILQFLLMLKQTSESDDKNQILDFGGRDNDLVDLGNFTDIVFDHKDTNEIEFDLFSKGGLWHENETLTSSIGIERNKMVFRALKSGGFFTKNEDRSKVYNQDYLNKASTRQEINDHFLFDLNDHLHSLVYIGPLREFPKRLYQWKNYAPADVGKRGQYAIEAIISDKGNIEQKIAQSLQKMALVDSFKVRPVNGLSDYWQVLIKKTKNSAEVLLTDVGFGVSQILPVLTSLFYSKEGSIIILEQPEIHLHPKAQAELADVIVEAINTRNIQVIIESHSEHLLSRIQSRIADGTFVKEKASLYFCKNETGASELEELKINDGGDIENWPVDFFGDMLGETTNRVISYLERKEKQNDHFCN